VTDHEASWPNSIPKIREFIDRRVREVNQITNRAGETKRAKGENFKKEVRGK